MAEELINMTEIAGALNKALMDTISPLVTIFQIVGIALLAYIIFLIIRAFFRWKTTAKVSQMARNVEEINKKMDILIEKLDGISKKEIKEAVKEEKKEKKGFFRRLFGKSKKDKIEENDKKIKKGKK